MRSSFKIHVAAGDAAAHLSGSHDDKRIYRSIIKSNAQEKVCNSSNRTFLWSTWSFGKMPKGTSCVTNSKSEIHHDRLLKSTTFDASHSGSCWSHAQL